MQVQYANPLAAFMGGQRMGQEKRQMRRQNALATLFQDKGAAIMAGDADALAEYAQFDPMGAMDVQRQAQSDARARELHALKVQEAFGSLNAQELAEEEAALRRAKVLVLQADTPEAWDAAATQHGQPDLVGRFEDRQAILNSITSTEDLIAQLAPKEADFRMVGDSQYVDMNNPATGAQAIPGVVDKPAAPLSTIGKLRSDLYSGLISKEDFEAELSRMAPRGMALNVGPDGSISFVEGAAGEVNLPKTTEGEKSSAGYLGRMRAAEEIFTELSVDEPAVRSMASLLVAGTDFEGLVLDERQERILQAQRDWVRAKLRKESGAVIGDIEMAEEVRTYFPLPGEGPKVVAQKAAARKQAERQMEVMAGAAASQANVVRQPEDGEGAFEGMSMDQLIENPPTTEAQAKAWNEAFEALK